MGKGSFLDAGGGGGIHKPTIKPLLSGHAELPLLCIWGQADLGRHLGHFIFSLLGLKRTLFTNVFQRL